MENKDLCKGCTHNKGWPGLNCTLYCYGVTKTDGYGTVWKCDDYESRPAESKK